MAGISEGGMLGTRSFRYGLVDSSVFIEPQGGGDGSPTLQFDLLRGSIHTVRTAPDRELLTSHAMAIAGACHLGTNVWAVCFISKAQKVQNLGSPTPAMHQALPPCLNPPSPPVCLPIDPSSSAAAAIAQCPVPSAQCNFSPNKWESSKTLLFFPFQPHQVGELEGSNIYRVAATDIICKPMAVDTDEQHAAG